MKGKISSVFLVFHVLSAGMRFVFNSLAARPRNPPSRFGLFNEPMAAADCRSVMESSPQSNIAPTVNIVHFSVLCCVIPKELGLLHRFDL